MADIAVDEGAEEVANIASTEQPSKVSFTSKSTSHPLPNRAH